MNKNQTTAAKLLMLLIAIIAWFALVLQLFLQIDNAGLNGLTTSEAIFNYFSYFTILTNLLVAVSLTFALQAPESNPGRFFLNPITQSAIGLYIVIVGIVYTIALRKIWDPQGLQLIADRLLHDAVPVLYLLFWLISIPKKVLAWNNVFSWLLYPFVYLVLVLTRGILDGWYAYPFLNGAVHGWGKVMLNITFIFLAFLGVGLLMVAINHRGAKSQMLKEPESSD